MLCRIKRLYYTVYTQQILYSLRYTSMTTCFGSLLIHLQVTYHVVDYVVAVLLLVDYPQDNYKKLKVVTENNKNC
jgi:hypothetical protein